MKLEQALQELRKEKKRNFVQTVELIVNLRKLNLKKDNINLVIHLPHAFKEKKVCAFLNSKSKILPTITLGEFQKYSDAKLMRKLAREYDYFIAQAALMPKVATTFGKVLGPLGKMPSPQLGMVREGSEDEIKRELEKISRAVKLRLKELSVKLAVGKEDMPDEKIIENIREVYSKLVDALPRKQENVKNVMIKFTMSRPVKVEV
ncbi:hypothetical protein D6817_02470 [Candidatus Pacearchaeota archaeon]|nr:MAG: hypothetical protein D6817_02470 [Candidatus Pacearchaeota archaeon]